MRSMAKRYDDIDVSGHRVYTGAQRMLRFVSLLYLCWYILLAVGGLASVAIFLLFGVDVSGWGGAPAPNREVALANGVMFAVDVAFNLCVSVSAWMAANHPVIARRFRVFAAVLVGLSALSAGYAAFFAQMANLMTSLYSLLITGLLLYLANQIAREVEAGAAVDHAMLSVDASGRRLRTERAVARAIERGELPLPPAASQEFPTN